MLWRYHIFILLIGVPTSRIFSTATFETSNAADEDIVDLIVRQLNQQKLQEASRQNSQTSNGNGVKNIPKELPVSASKKDQGLNLEAADEPVTQEGDPKTEDSPKQTPAEHVASGKTSALSHNPHHEDEESSRLLSSNDTKFAIFVGAGLAAGFIGIMVAGVCYYKFRRSAKAASDINYPAYGVTGPMKEKIPSPGDRKLAQSAQMYHYQHQKQQMIAMEKANGDMKHDASEDESEEDNVEGDYTVYECPGLAPTGEMEVKNPLFCGEEVPPPAGHGHDHAPSDQGQGRESPSSPSQSHRNH